MQREIDGQMYEMKDLSYEEGLELLGIEPVGVMIKDGRKVINLKERIKTQNYRTEYKEDIYYEQEFFTEYF